MATKAQILSDFSLLPLSVLERLDKYKNYIIIPEEDLLVNATMSSMVDKALLIADASFPEWTDRSKSDFGRYLVELIGLFSEKDFYYINAFAKESLVRKMNVYSNAFMRSIELGYTPAYCKAATVSIDATFSASTLSTAYLPGDLSIQIGNYSFINYYSFTIPANASPTTITLLLKEGSLVTENFSFNGYRIDLRTPRIDVASIKVYLDTLLWTRINVFGQSDASSKHYMVLPEEDGSATIFFGENGFGFTPSPLSNFNIQYIQCNGVLPNGITSTPTIEKSLSDRPCTIVVQNSATSGGITAETLADIKNNCLNFFVTQNVLNNTSTVKKWLDSQTLIRTSYVYCMGSYVYFYVQPKDGSVASGTLLTSLENLATPLINDGYSIHGLTTTYITCSGVSIDIYALKGFDMTNISAIAKSLIVDYTDPAVLGDYGKGFILADVEYLLKSNILGLQNAIFSVVNGSPAANMVLNPHEMLNKLASSNITITTHEV